MARFYGSRCSCPENNFLGLLRFHRMESKSKINIDGVFVCSAEVGKSRKRRTRPAVCRRRTTTSRHRRETSPPPAATILVCYLPPFITQPINYSRIRHLPHHLLPNNNGSENKTHRNKRLWSTVHTAALEYQYRKV